MKIRDIISEVASPGATSGKVVFSSDEAERLNGMMQDTILVRVETSPEDIHGMHAANGSIATVVSPHIAVGPDRFKKSYTGTPGKSGTKAPRLPKVVQPKKKDGTAKGAHALPGVSLFGGPLKR